jgi:anti-sigma regulatory factor (Ser/Thr protein kinase)
LSAIEQAKVLCERWPVWPGPPSVSERRTPSTATCALRPEPAAVGAARDFARVTLTDWRIDQLSDDVSLVVSELVTNALRHAMSVDIGEMSDGTLVAHVNSPPWIQLILLGAGSQLLCAVRDPSDQAPIRKDPDYIAQTGRGLHLVESFSLAWGWVPLPAEGKVVWALFPTY